MKIALYSDIHGNMQSFVNALSDMKNYTIDQHVFLGDICGYYYQQIEIFNILKTIDGLIAVRGNHDQIFIDIVNGNIPLRKEYRLKYGNSMEHLLTQPYEELYNWLISLPIKYIEPNTFIACHGELKNCLDGYVYPDTPYASQLEHILEPYVFLGHTHYQLSKSHGNTTIVNPGSLGQPRDGNLFSWALIDTNTNEITFKTVKGNITELCHEVEQMNEQNNYLTSVLARQSNNREQ
ncbi:MAG: metallophosphatase family protein [Fibrobacterales bacterium]